MGAQWLLAGMLTLAAGVAAVRDPAEDEREILRVEAALCRAFENGDADTLRKSLDERFTLTDSRGVLTSFEQTVAEVTRRDPIYEVFRNHNQTVRMYGDAAIVTGITTLKARSGGNLIEADFQFTDTWIHHDGRWKLAASHASRLLAGSPPGSTK